MQPVFNHQRRDRRDLDHLMTHRLWIISLEQSAAAAAGIGVVFHHLIHPLDRQQFRPTAGMARLTAALAATALAPLWRLKPKPVTGGWFGGVARAPVDPLPQLGQLARQGGELNAELIVLLPECRNLLLLSDDQRSDAGWSFQPVRIWNSSRECAHHRRSLPEMHPEIKLPSRVQQGRCSPRAVTPPERILGFFIPMFTLRPELAGKGESEAAIWGRQRTPPPPAGRSAVARTPYRGAGPDP